MQHACIANALLDSASTSSNSNELALRLPDFGVPRETSPLAVVDEDESVDDDDADGPNENGCGNACSEEGC